MGKETSEKENINVSADEPEENSSGHDKHSGRQSIKKPKQKASKEKADDRVPKKELDSVKEELADALGKNLDLTDKYMRTLAEFENFKKRSIRDLGRSIELESEKLILNVLPVLDDFDRAIQHGSSEKAPASVLEGFTRVKQKFLQVLKGFDVEPFDSVGEHFDPERHDALMTRPVENDEEDDVILEEFEKGYMKNEKVIRHSRVVVGKID